MVVPPERREFQRIQLDPPIPGSIDGQDALILDVGIPGARIENTSLIELGRGHLLSFEWNGERIEMECEVVRSDLSETMEHGRKCYSGLQFLQAVDHSDIVLRKMLLERVTELLRSRRTKRAHTIERQIDGDTTVRGSDAGFITFSLEGDRWKRRRSFLPEQPPVGFTIARGTDETDWREICDSYEASDDEGRRLIRLLAELNVSEAMNIPPRRA